MNEFNFNNGSENNQSNEPQNNQPPQTNNIPQNNNTNYYNQNQQPYYTWNSNIQPMKKGNAKKVVIVSISTILIFVLMVISFAFVVAEFSDDRNDSNNSSGADSDNGSLNNIRSDESHVSVSTSKNPQSDIAKLYDECQKSCVSIKTTLTNGYSIGSGFVIKENGYIITNHHVIDGYKSIKVVFYDGTEYEATLVGSDDISDIAVLKIEATGLPVLPLGDSDDLQIGDSVIAIGTPYDISLQGTLTQGVISGLDRKIEITNDNGSVRKIMKLIQTDSTINPGNSGGPLINTSGQVIGINTLKLMQDYEGIGFAIPMTGAVNLINQLIEFGKITDRGEGGFVTESGSLGITGSTVTKESLNSAELPEDAPLGVIIFSISSKKSAVYKAGLELFDIVTEFNGTKIETIEQLKNEIQKCSVGDSISMKVYRYDRNNNGSYHTINFNLEAAQN